LSIFPTCKIFREHDRTTELYAGDFTNLVIFCKKTSSPISFRETEKADFLGSRAREGWIPPRLEVDAGIFEEKAETQTETSEGGKVSEIQDWHKKSAVGHWGIMRGVVPPIVWDNW
jgi:hypothetical protein